MSFVPYDQFLPEVLPYVRDCPEFVAINAIRNAAIEFCEKSLIIREQLPPIEVIVGQADYDLEVIAGTTCAMIMSAMIGTKTLQHRSIEELDELFKGGWRERPGPIDYITQDHYENVRLVQTPEIAPPDPLRITIASRPTRASTKCNKLLYERYAEIIGMGARARLLDTPGQPYSDPESALRFRKWFESGFGEAKITANRGRGRAVLVVRPPSI